MVAGQEQLQFIAEALLFGRAQGLQKLVIGRGLHEVEDLRDIAEDRGEVSYLGAAQHESGALDQRPYVTLGRAPLATAVPVFPARVLWGRGVGQPACSPLCAACELAKLVRPIAQRGRDAESPAGLEHAIRFAQSLG